MNVGELLDHLILGQYDRTRTVYILDIDGTAQPVAHVVDLKHTNLKDIGVSIPDDIALMTANTYITAENLDE